MPTKIATTRRTTPAAQQPTKPRNRKWLRPLSKRAIEYLNCLKRGNDLSTIIRNRSQAGGAGKVIQTLKDRGYISTDYEINWQGKLAILTHELNGNAK